MSRGGFGGYIPVALILLVFLALSSCIAIKKSNTWDEPAHILAGYAYLKEGNDGLAPLNHPILGRAIVAALPMIFLDIDFDPKIKPEEAVESDFHPQASRFLYRNRVSGDTFLFLARLSNILLASLLGLYVFIWARELWGLRGGYLSLFLYALCPNIMGNAGLATTDIAITAFFFISSYYLFRLARNGSWPSAAAAGVFAGLAFATKHTAFLLIPVWAGAFLVCISRRRLADVVPPFLAVFMIAWVVIWAAYGFSFHYDGPHYAALPWERFSGSAPVTLINLLKDYRLLPESYLYGIAGTLSGVSSGKAAFLFGEHSNTGWLHYFVSAFLIKTPLPAIILLLAALLFGLNDPERRRSVLAAGLPALLIFTVFSIQKVNIGIRHVLPAYPFIFLLAGFVPLIRTSAERFSRGVLVLLLAWYAYSAVSVFPHQLAYFNELAGGPENGHYYLVDSNLDWGQDLKGLKAYMDEKGIERIKLAYFGLSDPAYFGIDYEYLPGFMIPEPVNVKGTIELKGWFAISATLLEGVYLPDKDLYRVFRESEPVDSIGYSIFIYKF